MLPEWRLLDDGIHEARHHFAVEEALARLLDEGISPPTLRLRQVNPAVFIGVHQNTWDEVDVDYCRENGIQVVRRMNGGGAVYHEMGSFCFSAFFPREMFTRTDQEIYHLFAEPVIRTCADYGLMAEFGGRNDILTGSRKIYGSAQFSWYSAFVQSGTFLVNMDFEAMERSLTPNYLKFANKTAHSITERVTSLSREVGRTVNTREVMDLFSNHFASTFEVQLTPGYLTAAESKLALELLESKYNTDRWNFGNKLEFEINIAEKTDAGVISLSVELEDQIIMKVRITGDILLSQHSALDDLEKKLVGISIQQAKEEVKLASLPANMVQSLSRLFDKLIKETIVTTSARRKERS